MKNYQILFHKQNLQHFFNRKLTKGPEMNV